MTITIDLPLETEEKVKVQAFHAGLNFDNYLQTLIKDAADRRERIEKGSKKTFSEILAPTHKGFEESGMSEDELDELLEKEREALWQEKQLAK